MSLSQQLQALRVGRGLSQEALAAQLNVSRQTVGKAAGYDYSQRACGPSDTSQGFFDSLKARLSIQPGFLLLIL